MDSTTGPGTLVLWFCPVYLFFSRVPLHTVGPTKHSISNIVDSIEGLIRQERQPLWSPSFPGAPSHWSPLMVGYLFRMGQQGDNEQVRGMPRPRACYPSGQ